MPFAEPHLAAFVADFGDVGTLDGRSVRGIYDDGTMGAPDLGGMAVQQLAPSYRLPVSSVQQPADRGAALLIPQGSFTVRRIEPVAGDPAFVDLLLQAAP